MTKLYGLAAHELIDMIKGEDISAEELVHSVFDRIEAVEDKIHGYSSLYKKESLDSAKKIDKKIKAKKKIGGLAGIPVAIKDNINALNTQTSCGSHILENHTSVNVLIVTSD